MRKRKILSLAMVLCFIVALAITQSGCTKKVDPISKEGYYLDTICNITIYDMDDMSEKKAEEAIDGAYEVCSKYENLLSKTRKESDIYKINHAEGQPVKCDPETIDVIKKGIEYGDMSDGLFDITIGKVTDLWNFHTDKPAVPKQADIDEALQDVTYKQIVIDGDTVRMTNPKGEIDLGGIAKGYIADRVTDYLQEQKVTGAVVNLGGNICALGHKDGKEGKDDFNIGVKKPYTKENEIVGTVQVSNKTVVTSGSYERYFEQDGKRYYHILDPKTGFPKETGLDSVTIVADIGKSCDCDALATICFMLGKDEGSKFIDRQKGYSALFIDTKGKITESKGMKGFKVAD